MMQAEIIQQVAPATSPWLDPRLLVAAAAVMVPVIMWFARLEFVTKANTARQKEFEESITEYVDEVRGEHRDLKKAYYGHATDTKVHHNEQMFAEFRTGLERRFTSIDASLQDISRKLDIHRTQ